MGGSRYTGTDYNDRVLANAHENAAQNQCTLNLARLDWCDVGSYLPQKFDYVIGSDLIYDGAPLENLARTVRHHLVANGQMLLVMPVKRHMTQMFVTMMATFGFSHSSTPLDSDAYRAPASPPSIGYRDFPELKTHSFLLHSFKLE